MWQNFNQIQMKKRRFRGKPPEEDHREKSELFKREQRVRERVFYYDDDDDGDEGEEEEESWSCALLVFFFCGTFCVRESNVKTDWNSYKRRMHVVPSSRARRTLSPTLDLKNEQNDVIQWKSTRRNRLARKALQKFPRATPKVEIVSKCTNGCQRGAVFTQNGQRSSRFGKVGEEFTRTF